MIFLSIFKLLLYLFKSIEYAANLVNDVISMHHVLASYYNYVV